MELAFIIDVDVDHKKSDDLNEALYRNTAHYLVQSDGAELP
jgi:hypothetical protein